MRWKFSPGAFGSDFVEQVYPQTIELQEKSGAVNDHAAAVQELSSWRGSIENQAAVLLERLIGEETRRRDEARAAFLQFWTIERGERLRFQLLRELGEVAHRFNRGALSNGGERLISRRGSSAAAKNRPPLSYQPWRVNRHQRNSIVMPILLPDGVSKTTIACRSAIGR